MPVIKLNLSGSSIDGAIKELKAYRKKVEEAGEALTIALVEQGVELAKQNADYMSIYDTGELVDGIVPEFRDGKGYVFSSAPHSAFCEFGTGIRGAESPHPEPGLANWKYDTNSHGEEGWWYKGDDGQWHWTAGMPSRPYMYNTAQQLKEQVLPLAKEVFR